MYNKLLQEQLKTYLGDKKIPAEYAELFRAVSKSYDMHNRQYKLQDRSIEWSSGEMMKLNSKLTKESIRLKGLEREIKILFANTDTVFFSFDVLKYRYDQVSEACEKVFGYPPEEFNVNPLLWRIMAHPDDKYMFEDHIKRLSRGERVFYEYRIIRKDKSIRWLDVKIIPFLDADGALVRLTGIVNDITRRKETEQKILNAEHLLNEAQELAHMGNWNGDMVKDELYVSDSLRKILGIGDTFRPTVSSFIGMLHPEDRGRVAEEIRNIKAKEDFLETSYRIIRANDGQVRAISSFIHSISDENGNIIRLYGISQDITESKDAQLKIEKLNMLVYQISHDLRGPLNSAKNYIYLALKRVNDKTAQNYLSKIHDSYARMEHRVLSLLDLQRMNRPQVNIERIELPILLKDIVSSIDGIKGYNEIGITTDVDVKDEVYSDRQFLHSIFHNLISNAVTYRRPLINPYIHINVKEEDGRLVVKISDNGQGIPENMHPRLFEKFVKGATSTNGTGLGLYIVRQLVTRLGGEITVDSEVDKGTTFTIKLPILSAEVTPQEVLSYQEAG